MSFETSNFLAGLFSPKPTAPEPTTPAPEAAPVTSAGDTSAPVTIRAVPGPGGCLSLVCPAPELAAAIKAGRPALESLLVKLASEPSAPAVGPEAADWPGDGIKADWACSACGGLLWWEDLAGGRHCSACEARKLARALKLAERAARLRRLGRSARPESIPTAEAASPAAPRCEPAAALDTLTLTPNGPQRQA